MKLGRYVVVAFGSRIARHAPAGELEPRRLLWTARRTMWEYKRLTGYMEFGVMDTRTQRVVAATDGESVGRQWPTRATP